MLFERALSAPGRGRLGCFTIAAAALLATLSLTSAADASGPISSLTTLQRTSLRTGVTFTHYRAKVSGYPTPQQLYVVSWQEGNPHAALGVSLLGRYLASPNSVDVQPISSWYATRRPADLVAAVNGDFSYYASNGMRPSGIGVSSRQVYWYGWGGPAAGYKPGGSVVFGRPRALAAKLYFPGGAWATIGAWNALPARSDQVGVYTSAGHNVSIPSGSIAAVATGDALARLLRGTKPLRNSTGLGVAETAKGFVLDDGLTAGTVPRSLLPLAAPATGATSVAVPAGGAVLVASANGIAGQGLTTLLARAGPLSVTAPEPTWAAVTDVMGGKPQLVIRGVPVSARPDYVDTWQWTCGGGCWRTALSVTGMRRASLVVDGDVRGGGVTMPVFARMLRQLGAANAMGFDNNGSTDMFRPRPNDGSCISAGWCATGYGWERSVPLATSLFWH